MKTSIFSSASKQSPHSSERAFASSLRDASSRARTLSQSHASFRSSTAKICICIHSLPLLFNVSLVGITTQSENRSSGKCTVADSLKLSIACDSASMALPRSLRGSATLIAVFPVNCSQNIMSLVIGLPCRECVQWLSCSHPSRSQRCIDPFGKERNCENLLKRRVPRPSMRQRCAWKRPEY